MLTKITVDGVDRRDLSFEYNTGKNDYTVNILFSEQATNIDWPTVLPDWLRANVQTVIAGREYNIVFSKDVEALSESDNFEYNFSFQDSLSDEYNGIITIEYIGMSEEERDEKGLPYIKFNRNEIYADANGQEDLPPGPIIAGRIRVDVYNMTSPIIGAAAPSWISVTEGTSGYWNYTIAQNPYLERIGYIVFTVSENDEIIRKKIKVIQTQKQPSEYIFVEQGGPWNIDWNQQEIIFYIRAKEGHTIYFNTLTSDNPTMTYERTSISDGWKIKASFFKNNNIEQNHFYLKAIYAVDGISPQNLDFYIAEVFQGTAPQRDYLYAGTDKFYKIYTGDQYINYYLTTEDDKIIYEGNTYAIKNIASIYLNNIIKNYTEQNLSNVINDFKNTGGVFKFKLYVQNSLYAEIYAYNDWQNDLLTGNLAILNNPVEWEYTSGQYLSISALNKTEGEEYINIKTFEDNIFTLDGAGYFNILLDDNFTARNNIEVYYGNETKQYKYKKYKACDTLYELIYRNTAGGFDNILFRHNSTQTNNITRDNIQTEKYNNIWGWANRTIETVQKRSWKLQSKFYDDAKSYIFANNILRSPEVYLHKLGDDEIIPVIITDKNITIKTRNNQRSKLVQYAINVEESDFNRMR